MVRSRCMAGFDAPYLPGWDCHGLPIELQVDKNLGTAKKREMGPVAFATGSHHFKQGRDLEISDRSEEVLSRLLPRHGFRDAVEPFDLGEVSFHWGWTFHHAPPNHSGRPRSVMTIIYMDAAMRLAEPKNKNQKQDWDTWCPGAKVGAVIDSPINPVLHSRAD